MTHKPEWNNNTCWSNISSWNLTHQLQDCHDDPHPPQLLLHDQCGGVRDPDPGLETRGAHWHHALLLVHVLKPRHPPLHHPHHPRHGLLHLQPGGEQAGGEGVSGVCVISGGDQCECQLSHSHHLSPGHWRHWSLYPDTLIQTRHQQHSPPALQFRSLHCLISRDLNINHCFSCSILASHSSAATTIDQDDEDDEHSGGQGLWGQHQLCHHHKLHRLLHSLRCSHLHQVELF